MRIVRPESSMSLEDQIVDCLTDEPSARKWAKEIVAYLNGAPGSASRELDIRDGHVRSFKESVKK